MMWCLERALLLEEADGRTPTPSTSRTSLDLGKGQLPGKKPTLNGKVRPFCVFESQEFVLDIENKREREALTADIRKLGGVVLDCLNEDKLPTCIVSDHEGVDKIVSLQNRQLTTQVSSRLK